MEVGFTILLIILVIYASVARWLAGYSITMPIVFVLVGLLISPRGLNLLSVSPSAELVLTLTEFTLALLLFADASTLDLGTVLRDDGLPARLLFLAMPLVMVLGALLAWLLFPIELAGYALLLATILAPTDAALGMAIFGNPKIPVRIRRALNVESGLNDGIATPFITLFLGLALAETEGTTHWLVSALAQIGTAVVVGGLVGAAGARLLSIARQRGWTEGDQLSLAVLALGLCCYLCAVGLQGNGFIAAFAGGLVFGSMARSEVRHAAEYTEITGTFLSTIVWSLFGATLVPIALFDLFSWRMLLYAVLSLTLVRMVPVWIGLRGTGLRTDTAALMGWFGPRGLASVVFTLIAFVALEEGGLQNEVLLGCAIWTILLSVVLHGISAKPGADWYASQLQDGDESMPEMMKVPDVKERRAIFSAHTAPATQLVEE